MRIAMISEHASPLAALGGVDAGGQNAHVAELAAALAGHGHQVRVYTRRDSPGLPEVAPMLDGVDVAHVPAGPATGLPKDELLPYMGEFAEWTAADWRDEWKPDVVHAHFWMSGLAALDAGRACHVPVVQTFHALGSVKRRYQGAADTSPARRIGLERHIGRTADRIVVQCRDEIGELLRLGVPRSRMSLVPSGVNTERFSDRGPAVPRRPGLARILTVARLVERKGIEDTVRAMRGVPGAELVVVGGPPAGELRADPYARRLQALARHCGVADRVTLVGAVPAHEMPAWYRSADVLAATPWYEPFGLTPLEAMACGVPVVATEVGGLTDTVVDGITGDLVPPRDPRALATALRRLLADDVRRYGYAAAAADRAAASYSWPRIAERLAAVYTTVAELEVAA
ncbi:glycosyl transferase [Actinoplanes philippinensis]|uniref:Glycosyltransferase involved in cell wall bisynthesis n=1 Tax=Actinoplanes philippinensis TaxID=35752 RepID=A0A1I2GUF5_9ACTN|nr:glycosyltransferase [Actinoplanes philippinensis]GIE78062.1 glycosyl transferase [Actinoplanes philippinensis]SFF20457.1 Glycosyltransferase involved in cell wall bisynthesis [Actinoplanes philippinensis]